jgi:hypothetical protein
MKNFLFGCLIALACSLASLSAASAQSAPKHYLSTASTNCTLVQGGRTIVRNILPVNTTAVIYYLKLYDKLTAPVANSDTPVLTIPVPVGTAAATVPVFSVDGFSFLNGMGFCLTGGVADNDNTNAATGVAINFGVSAN